MKQLLFALLWLMTSVTFAQQGDYLKAGPEFFTTVHGDGYEAGFTFEITVYGSQKASGPLTYQRPEVSVRNDAADCSYGARVSQGPIKSQLAYTYNGTSVYKLTFSAHVDTAVNADTGGCLVLATKGGGSTDILKIVQYSYVTGY